MIRSDRFSPRESTLLSSVKSLASAVTPKAANDGHLKTGQMESSQNKGIYSA
jgi:hypothetical protein